MRAPAQHDVWSVTALNRASRELLESSFGSIWVEAEVSNLARPASGHVYFSLKDGQAQVRAAFFRQRQRGSARDLANGDQVLVRGRLSLYEPRGDYQLIVEHLEPAGEGLLRRAFEQLKRKLHAEGLFGAERKRDLPALPSRIGVITSPSGAAVRDILKVLGRRMPSVPVLIYGASVQGRDAPAELRRALALAVARNACAELILARGGGSLEDLAAFNDEGLARDIADCPIPTLAGGGHEVDVTIADYVADARAPTPSAAAELAVPDGRTLLEQARERGYRLSNATDRLLQRYAQRMDQLARRLQSQGPSRRLAEQRRLLERLTQSMRRSGREALDRRLRQHAALAARLRVQSPATALARRKRTLSDLAGRLVRAETAVRRARTQRLGALAKTLQAVSPLATLGRGYAVVRDTQGDAVTDAVALKPGDAVAVTLRDGVVDAAVRGVRPKDD